MAKIFYGEVHKDDGSMIKIFKVNIIYQLIDMAKTILLQGVVLNCHRKLCNCYRKLQQATCRWIEDKKIVTKGLDV